MTRKINKPQEFSLTHKLSTLRVGEMMYLPDDFDGLESSDASVQQRQVYTAPKRSKFMEGRRFKTERCVVVKGYDSEHVLMIERIK